MEGPPSVKYRVYIHSETRTWHDNKIQFFYNRMKMSQNLCASLSWTWKWLFIVERIYFSPKNGIYHLDINIYISHTPCFDVRSLVERVVFRSVYSLPFFSIWAFFHEHSRITGMQGNGEDISLSPHYHFHPLHRHSDISRAIAAGSSPLQIASSPTQVGNLWFLRASR